MEATKKHFWKRDAILDCLRHTDAHPSAETVHQMLHEDYPEISMATVYRNLALFKRQGLIQSVGTVGGVERFDGNPKPHVHFICTACDAVIDLSQMEVPQSLNQEAERWGGCTVDSCQLTFTGRCADCGK